MIVKKSLKTLANTRGLDYNSTIGKVGRHAELQLNIRRFRRKKIRQFLTKLIHLYTDSMNSYFYTRKQVIEVTGLSRSTIDRLEDKGIFPKRVRIPDTNRIFWYQSPVHKWMEGLKNA